MSTSAAGLAVLYHIKEKSWRIESGIGMSAKSRRHVREARWQLAAGMAKAGHQLKSNMAKIFILKWPSSAYGVAWR
jgi:hypothetical protein